MRKYAKLVLALILILSITVSFLFSVFGMNKRKDGDKEREYRIISAGVYEAVQSELSKPIYISTAMANDTFLIDMLQREETYSLEEAVSSIGEYLTSVKEATGAQTAFLVSDGTKRYYSCEGLNKIIDTSKDEHDVWYPIFVNTRKAFDLDVDTDQVNGNRWSVFINTRIQSADGKLLGVCGLGLSMERLQDLIKQYQEQYGVKINFIDCDGVVQVDTEDVNIETAYLYDVQYGKEKDGYAYKNASGEFVVMRFVDVLNWYMVVRGVQDKVSMQDILPIAGGSLAVLGINLAALFIIGKEKKKEQVV